MLSLLTTWRSKIAVAVALLFSAAVLVVILIGPRAAAVLRRDGAGATLLRMGIRLPGEIPDVFWVGATPETHGVDGQRLRALSRSLGERETSAFLVAKGGDIIEEFYGPDFGPNRRYGIAAMGKAATASLVLLIALDKQIVALDDPVWKYIPEWRDEPLKRDVTIRHLVTHSSGLDDVDFRVEQEEEWKGRYLESEDVRFEMAVREIPIIFPPGSRLQYSGVGFYALAYVLGKAFADSQDETLFEVVREQVMWPMEIPDRSWRVSYGDSYQVDGMELIGLGSGGSYTARALGRIGQTLLQGGRWGDRRLADSALVAAALRYGGSPTAATAGVGNPSAPVMGLGFWLNCAGFWPSLPRDAVIGLGAGEQLLLVVPSLDLVVVRQGHGLGSVEAGNGPWQPLDGAIFAPLMAAMPTTLPSAAQATCQQ